MIDEGNPNLLSLNLWAARQAHFTQVVIRALGLLNEVGAAGEETTINRQLYFCLLKASRELDPEGIYPGPLAECCNQPDPDDSARAARENKRPDFTWSYLDPHEPDTARSSIQFVLECKRIGKPTSPQWILTKNYVEHGVQRFVDPRWAYGKRFPSALMVAYWQSSSGDRLLEEINCLLAARGLATISLSEHGWQTCSITELFQILLRTFPQSPFQLVHLWIDLRSKAER